MSMSRDSSLMSILSPLASFFSLITSSSILFKVCPSLWKLLSMCLLRVTLCWCTRWRICVKRVSMVYCAACMKVLQFPSQGPGFWSTSIHLVNSSTVRQYNTESETHMIHEESSQFTQTAVCWLFPCSLRVLAAAFLSRIRKSVGYKKSISIRCASLEFGILSLE